MCIRDSLHKSGSDYLEAVLDIQPSLPELVNGLVEKSLIIDDKEMSIENLGFFFTQIRSNFRPYLTDLTARLKDSLIKADNLFVSLTPFDLVRLDV